MVDSGKKEPKRLDEMLKRISTNFSDLKRSLANDQWGEDSKIRCASFAETGVCNNYFESIFK